MTSSGRSRCALIRPPLTSFPLVSIPPLLYFHKTTSPIYTEKDTMGKVQLSPALFIGVQGEDIISFGSGQPDLPPPDAVYKILPDFRDFKLFTVRTHLHHHARPYFSIHDTNIWHSASILIINRIEDKDP